MFTKSALIINDEGLHARPASMFVQCAKKFRSDITAIKGEMKANAKSIINVLCLAAEKGSEIQIAADGDDEMEAVETLVSLLNGGFKS
jgi:phosphocarrier protein